jgi:hypothetical protein
MITWPSKFRSLFWVVLVFVTTASCAKASRHDEAPAVVSPALEKPAEPSANQASAQRAVAHEIQVVMRSPSPGNVVAQVIAMTEARGGYVVSSDIRAAAPGTLGAEVALRIPTTHVEPLLGALRKTGEIRSELRKGDDVSFEVTDTEARLVARRTIEKRLLELLSSARSVDDMLKVESELSRVRTEIEQLTGQSRSLAQRVEFALLRLTIESPEANRAAEDSFATRLANAFRSALSTSQSVVLGFVEFLGAVVPLTVLGSLSWLLLRVLRLWLKARKAALVAKASAATEI